MNIFDRFDRIDKLDEEAFKIRNLAGIKSSEVDRLKTAAKKFLELSSLYYELSTIDIYEYYKKLIALANSEHIKYEYETALFIYNYRKGNNKVALNHLKNSEKYIENAIKYLNEAEKNMSTDANINTKEDIKYDKNRWTYYKLQISVQQRSLTAMDAFEDGKISEAYDMYKVAIDKHLELLNITKKYYDYLDLNYLRIAESNYLMMYSNYHRVYVKLLDEHSNAEHILPEIVKNLWNAYSKSIEAIKIFPEGDIANKVAQSQLKQLNEVLIDNKSSWKLLINKFDNHDLLNHMKQLDNKTYNKVISNGGDNMFKNGIMWLSFFISITLIVFGGYKLFGIIGTITTIGCILIVFVVFILVTLRSSDKLSEDNFVDLLKHTLDKYFKDFKSFIDAIKKK